MSPSSLTPPPKSPGTFQPGIGNPNSSMIPAPQCWSAEAKGPQPRPMDAFHSTQTVLESGGAGWNLCPAEFLIGPWKSEWLCRFKKHTVYLGTNEDLCMYFYGMDFQMFAFVCSIHPWNVQFRSELIFPAYCRVHSEAILPSDSIWSCNSAEIKHSRTMWLNNH